jgi:hypothetical protein
MPEKDRAMPIRQKPRTHLTDDQLREYWLSDLARLDAAMAERYRTNGVLFPKSRFDLIEYYTELDKKNFKLESE